MRAGAPLLGLGLILGIALGGSLVWFFLTSSIPWPHADAWVAIFTATLTLSTIFLWLATYRLAADAKESSERELRAYPGITGANIYFNDNRIIIRLTAQNLTKTPAYKFRYAIIHDVLDVGATIGFREPIEQMSIWDMAPGSTTN